MARRPQWWTKWWSRQSWTPITSDGTWQCFVSLVAPTVFKYCNSWSLCHVWNKIEWTWDTPCSSIGKGLVVEIHCRFATNTAARRSTWARIRSDAREWICGGRLDWGISTSYSSFYAIPWIGFGADQGLVTMEGVWQKNENLLEGVFRECNSNADLPTVIFGDFNIKPEFFAVVAAELLSGNWVDVGESEALAKGELPQWTFCQKETTSRLDPCLMNGAAMHLLHAFEIWGHEHCTFPNHRMQCMILKIGSGEQMATKVKRPYKIPEHDQLCWDDHQFLTRVTVEKFHDELTDAYEQEDVEWYWSALLRPSPSPTRWQNKPPHSAQAPPAYTHGATLTRSAADIRDVSSDPHLPTSADANNEKPAPHTQRNHTAVAAWQFACQRRKRKAESTAPESQDAKDAASRFVNNKVTVFRVCRRRKKSSGVCCVCRS